VQPVLVSFRLGNHDEVDAERRRGRPDGHDVIVSVGDLPAEHGRPEAGEQLGIRTNR
jgi:hypothetical protein